MLFDELKEALKNFEPHLDTIKNFVANSTIEAEYHRLLQLSKQEDFWQHAEELKELQRLRAIREQHALVFQQYADLNEMLDLFQDDETELAKLRQEIFSLGKQIKKFKITLLLSDELDTGNCFLHINSGAGGTESQDWAEIMLRMYVRFCEREKLNASMMDFQPGEGAGIKSATLFVKGKNAYGLLKSEVGVHRLVRISPFDAAKRRHTSFAAVSITPEMPDVQITIDTKDLRIDTYRASGAGGQHVNKTESAVRITHMPTNIVVQCQNERSQMQNRETAMKMLMAKLAHKEREEQKAELNKVEKKKIEWGSQIRSYVLHPYKLVKDHRTDFETSQAELVLDGDLMDFIESYLIYSACN